MRGVIAVAVSVIVTFSVVPFLVLSICHYNRFALDRARRINRCVRHPPGELLFPKTDAHLKKVPYICSSSTANSLGSRPSRKLSCSRS
jgi:hypothetical protein